MPLLTLTSDFGIRDYLVAAVKAQLIQYNPGMNIVDISHNISPFNYPQAAYLCKSAIKNFPEFTYHLILVSLFESKPKQLLIAFHKNQYLICADNGLLTMILEENPEAVTGISLDDIDTKDTIHIVATMAKAIQRLASGEPLQNIGTPDVDYIQKNHLRPMLGSDWIEGQILFIDNFENVIINITREQFEQQRAGRNFRIIFKRDEMIDRISDSYADVPEGEKLALFNSAGYLEIAINKGNAAGLLGLKGFSEKTGQVPGILQNQLAYQTVRVFFE
ncbi:MAG TPA: SAM-dependent chlorinase/fluorinase [Chitinophagaceae bacterium]|jgi:S-adenosylmethionine hydrolase|nr:SAM-dependent chlorinase/fluorinase [Chitinophagaceae bacterium]